MTSPPGFFDLEPLIIDRLRSALPDVRVISADEISELGDRGQVAPALHVIYGGFGVPSTSTDKRAARVRQIWIISAAVKCAVQRQGSRPELRSRASELIDPALQALMGWQPRRTDRPLELAPAPRVLYQGGIAFFSIAFAAEFPVEAPRHAKPE